jgi:hypothetical protein
MTNNRRRGDSTLLVSFCSVREGKHDRANRPVVAPVDLLDEQARVWWIEIKDGAHLKGARGLCYWNGLVCVAHQPGARNDPPRASSSWTRTLTSSKSAKERCRLRPTRSVPEVANSTSQ